MFPIFRPVHIVLLVYLSPQLSPAKTLGKNELGKPIYSTGGKRNTNTFIKNGMEGFPEFTAT